MGRTSPTLTKDQRWLCYGVDHSRMIDCLTDPATGIPALMQTMYGSSTAQRGGEGPDWLRRGVHVRGNVIATGMVVPAEPFVQVTSAQLTAFAATLPGKLIAQMAACRRSARQLAVARWDWCRCGRDTCTRERHYTDTEWAEEIQHRQRTRVEEDRLLRAAFGIDAMAEPDDLFDLLDLTDH